MTNPTETTCPKCGADSKGALEYKCGTKHSPKGAVHLYSDLCRATSAERAVEILKQHVSDLELHVSSDGVRLGLVDSLREKRRKVAELERDLAAAQRKVERLKAVRADYRDCIELAGKISERVETYDGDCLPEVIIPFLQPLIGELADRDRQIEGLRDAFQDAAHARQDLPDCVAHIEALEGVVREYGLRHHTGCNSFHSWYPGGEGIQELQRGKCDCGLTSRLSELGLEK